MKVSDVMHRGISCVDPDAPLIEVAERMRKDDVGALAVGSKEGLIGMVTDRDLVVRGLGGKSDPLQLTARDVMTEPVAFCTENEDIEDAVRIMERKAVRRLPVFDERHKMVGMLSLGDVAARATSSICAETLRAVSAHHA